MFAAASCTLAAALPLSPPSSAIAISLSAVSYESTPSTLRGGE